MNNARRKRLRAWSIKANTIKSELEDILSEEEAAFDNMPEGLQASERGMESEDAINSLSEAVDYMDDAIAAVDEII